MALQTIFNVWEQENTTDIHAWSEVGRSVHINGQQLLCSKETQITLQALPLMGPWPNLLIALLMMFWLFKAQSLYGGVISRCLCKCLKWQGSNYIKKHLGITVTYTVRNNQLYRKSRLLK